MAVTSPQTFQPGFRLVDGTELNNMNASGGTRSVDNAVTALGTTLATAYQIKAALTVFSVVAASTGALLPSNLQVGQSVVIYNSGASPLTVYAPSGGTIDGTAGATGVALANAKRCQYTLTAAGVWVSAQLGAVSA